MFPLTAALAVAVVRGADDPAPHWSSSMIRQPASWMASPVAEAAAKTLLSYQCPTGAWPKNHDLFQPVPEAERQKIRTGGEANTIDNGATTTPMRFLAQVNRAAPREEYRAAFLRGLDYLLAAQYPNGGWPQFYPLRDHGYYSHVTFNDNAMVNVLELLHDIATGKEVYAFVDPERRAKAAAAVARGTDCILRCQIKQAGKLTGWCAQHDEKTLAPAWARNFEPPSLSGGETVGIVRFLMSIEPATPEITAAVDGAVQWLASVVIHGIRVQDFVDAKGAKDRRAVEDPKAPDLWARFYELETSRPIFVGRDRVVHYAFNEIEQNRRAGYLYYGDWPHDLIARDYPKWREKRAGKA